MKEIPPQSDPLKVPEQSIEKKESLNFSDLTIFTTTLYKDDPISKVRENLAKNLIENAERLNAKLVIIDGGSNANFIDYIKSKPTIELVMETESGMGESRRDALNVAMEKFATPYYFWVEPEKDDLIKSESLTAMISGLRENTTDIVVPRRLSTKSMPTFQAWIESRANKRANQLMQEIPNETLDLWFGPKMFNREGAKYFLNYTGELDKWDSIIKPVIEAYGDGKRVSSVDVNYVYDESQKNSEESDKDMKRKRIQQYSQILSELGDKFWKEKSSK